MIAPCKDCQRRRPACWADCEDYAGWRAEMDAERKARMAENEMQIRLDAIGRKRRRRRRR